MPVSTLNDVSKLKEITDKLKRIEGRVRGLGRMIEDRRDSMDILMQISATHESLRVVSKSVVQSYLQDQIPKGLMATNASRREDAYGELLEVLYKYVK